MELFSLLAKLTLDKKDFEKGLSEAKGEGSFDIDDPSLGLDKSEFDRGIAEAEDTDVDDPEEPELDLDKDPFDTKVEAAEDTDVDDPDSPELGLDTEDFDKGVTDAEEQGTLLGEVLGGIFQNIQGVLVTTGIVGAVTSIVGALKEGVSLAKNHGDQIDKQSQKMAISAKAYQEWSYALTLSGASITDLNRGLKNWRTAIGNDTKEKELVEAFEALGIGVDDAFAQIESAAAGTGTLDKLLDQVITGLTQYGEGDRGRIMKLLFGNSSTELMALLGQTGDEIHAALQEADELGLVMTDEEVKNAAAYMDATTRLEQSLSAIKESFAAGILPMLTDASNLLADIIASFNWRTGGNTLADQFNELDKSVTNSVTNLEKREATAISLLEKLQDLGDYYTLDDQGKKTWDTLAEELIKLFPELDGVIDTNSKKINSNTQEITKNIKEWTKLEKQRLLDENIAQKRQAVAKQYADALDKEIEAELKEADAEGEKIQAIKDINGYLKQLGYEQLGDNATYEQIKAAQSLIKSSNPFDAGYQQRVENLTNSYEKALMDAEGLREESENMTKEADEASADLEKYTEKLAEKLGITTATAQQATGEVENLKKALDDIPNEKRITLYTQNGASMFKQAKGDWTVPYDNYPSLLHRGEMVLTKSQARQYRDGGSDFNADDLGTMVAVAVDQAMSKVYVMLSGEKVGDLTTKRVKRNINASSYNKIRAYGG